MRKGFTTSFSIIVTLSLFLIFLFFHGQAHAASLPTQLVPDCGPGQICGWSNLIALANNFITFLVYFSAAVATISFAYAGFLLLTAGGNSEQISKAKGMFWKVLIGFIFVLVAWLLVETILKLLGVTGGFSILGS